MRIDNAKELIEMEGIMSQIKEHYTGSGLWQMYELAAAEQRRINQLGTVPSDDRYVEGRKNGMKELLDFMHQQLPFRGGREVDFDTTPPPVK